MSLLLAPVFAQLVTLELGDRTEARYVKYETDHYEGSTSPEVGLEVSSRRSDFSLSYGPTLTLLPLERKPRDLLVFHAGSASAGYRLRMTTLTLSSYVGVGEVNFRLAALQGQTAPGQRDDAAGVADAPGDDAGGAPADASSDPGSQDPASGQPQIVDQVVRYYTWTTSLNLTHRLSRDLQLGGYVAHTRAGGIDADSRAIYERLQGFTVGGSAMHTYRISNRDQFVGNLTLAQTWSSNGNDAATLNATETWEHRFDRRTGSSLGAGLNITRFSQDSGLRGFSIFPTFQATLAHQATVARGTLSMAVYAYSNPALDPLRALVDPRLGFGAGVGYSRDRFSSSVSGNTQVSLAPVDNDAGAVDAAQAEANVGYRIADFVQADGGVRYVRQAFQGVTVLPSSWAAFVGLSFGYRLPLVGNRR